MTTQKLDSYYTGQIGSSTTDMTTTTDGERKYIGQLTMTNTSASAIVVHVHKIDTAGTETTGSGGNYLAKKTLQSEETWNVIETTGQIVMTENQTLSAVAGTASVVNGEVGGYSES